MTSRAVLTVFVIVIAPLGIATWILASHTVGESLNPNHSTSIGFAVALLAMMAAGTVLLLSRPPEAPNVPFGIVLVVCGTACVLLALLLQFYLAYLMGENSRRLAEILAENMRRGHTNVNVNLNPNYPVSVSAISYFAVFAGLWLAAMGIRMGVSGGRPERAAFSPSHDQPMRGEEVFRQTPDR